jgi:hypothetical protein
MLRFLVYCLIPFFFASLSVYCAAAGPTHRPDIFVPGLPMLDAVAAAKKAYLNDVMPEKFRKECDKALEQENAELDKIIKELLEHENCKATSDMKIEQVRGKCATQFEVAVKNLTDKIKKTLTNKLSAKYGEGAAGAYFYAEDMKQEMYKYAPTLPEISLTQIVMVGLFTISIILILLASCCFLCCRLCCCRSDRAVI